MNTQELKHKHGIQVVDLGADNVSEIDMFLFCRDTRDGLSLYLISDNLKLVHFEEDVFLDRPSIDEILEILSDREAKKIYCDDFEYWFEDNF